MEALPALPLDGVWYNNNIICQLANLPQEHSNSMKLSISKIRSFLDRIFGLEPTQSTIETRLISIETDMKWIKKLLWLVLAAVIASYFIG